MAQNTQTFILVGKFQDQITPSLKKLNKTFGALERSLQKGISRPFKELNKETREFGKDLNRMSKLFGKKSEKAFTGLTDGLKAANAEAMTLNRTIRDMEKAGFTFDKSGIRAAQEDAKVLGDILKANALIKVGEGFSNALAAGAHSAVNILQKGMGFVGNQFRSAVQDQMEDLQARGSLYGSLKKQGLFTGKTAEEQTSDYRQTKAISRANEQAIGQLIRTSSVSTSTVTTLNRQLTDNLLPTLLKAKGITDLSGKSREELDKIFGGKEGIGTDLARLYEQMATIMPSPQYAKMGAMGFTQALTSGTINRQLAIFENNPVLVDALKTIDGGIQGTADIGKRIQILRKALEVAAPTMMLDEMRNTIAGGMQAVQDTIMNPTVGILSLGADIANEGKKTLQQYKESGAYQLKMERVKRNIMESADKQRLTGLKREQYIAKQMKEAADKLDDALESADSPIEKISVSLAPVLQSFATLLNTFGNLFIGPVTSIMNSLYKPLAQLEQTFEYLATDVDLFMKTGGKEGRSIGEALGRAFAEFFKALAQYFNPQKAGEEIGNGITRFFDDFMKGFNAPEAQGSKWMKRVLDTLGDIIMKMIFKDGNVLKGMTPLGDALTKVFLLLAAPAFISSLISGLIPIAILSMGGLIKGVFSGLASKALSKVAPKVTGDVAKKSLGARAASLVSGQADVAAGVGAKLPGMAKPLAMAKGAKMKGVSTIAAAMISLSSGPMPSKLAKAGKAVTNLGKRIPLLSVAFAGMDFAAQKAEGKSTAQAGLSAGGGLVGGMAGAAIGQALIPIPGVGAVAGGALGSFIGSWLGENLAKIGPALSSGLIQVRSALQSFNLGKTLGWIAGQVQNGWDQAKTALANFGTWFMGLGPKFMSWAQGAISAIGQGIQKIGAFLSNPSSWASMATAAWNGFKAAISNALGGIGNWWNSFKAGAQAGYREARAGQNVRAKAKGEPGAMFGSLGQAVNYEMKHKPPGSDLVIANSSETIIPAADGLGNLKGLIDAIWGSAAQTRAALGQGFGALASTVKMTSDQSRQATQSSAAATQAAIRASANLTQNAIRGSAQATQSAIRQSTMANMRGDQQILAAIKAAAASGGLGGGAMGTAKGSLGAAEKLAQSMGLQTTSGYRPGDPGYHGANRARDFSNGTGPTPQMMAFAQKMASTYGTSLTELIYTPLGFGIKNGKKVPPYAAAAHYNHVHVAFANGLEMPTLFTRAAEAAKYEEMKAPLGAKVATVTANSSEASPKLDWSKMMAPEGARVASVTANSSESSGGTINLTQNVSVSGAQDPRATAEAVWRYTAEVVQQQTRNNFG